MPITKKINKWYNIQNYIGLGMTKIGNSKPASQGLKYVFNPSTTQACPPFVRDILPKVVPKANK